MGMLLQLPIPKKQQEKVSGKHANTGITSYIYDKRNNLTSVTDANTKTRWEWGQVLKNKICYVIVSSKWQDLYE
jgi:hypothetical protein